MNLANYFPVLLFILVGIGVGLVPMFLGKILAPSKPDAEKLSPYECGFEAFEDARMKFDVRYYLIARSIKVDCYNYIQLNDIFMYI